MKLLEQLRKSVRDFNKILLFFLKAKKNNEMEWSKLLPPNIISLSSAKIANLVPSSFQN